MTGTMRAAVYHGARDIRIEEIPRPRPAPDELLLRVHANGICGTDASEFVSGPLLYPLHDRHPLTGHEGPIVPGHEFAGHVVERGAAVRGFREGELIVTGAALYCGACRPCRAGRTSICDRYATIGLHRDGGLAEYVCVPAHVAFHAEPLALRPDVAALTQPMAVAVHAMRRARARAGQEVVVIGTGGIGAFLTYALSRAGVHVVAVDVLADRLAVARKLGAAATLDVGDPPGLRAALTGLGVAPTLVFEVTGHEAGVAAAIASVEPGGRIVTVGIPKHNLALDTRRVTTKELEIVGTNALVASEDVPEAARLLGLNHAVWSSVAPVAIPLERVVEDGLIPMIEGRATRIKTLVDPWISAERPTTMTDFARSAASHESATP